MKTFKIKDNAGKRFNIKANNREDAKIKAKKQTTASVVYILN